MILLLKQMLMRLFNNLFKIIPLTLVRWIIKVIPRLSVSAPAGVVCVISDYLGEFSINVDSTYAIERKMLSGSYEKSTFNIIEKYVNEGDICFDIGANVGPVMFALVQKITLKGKIYAFEPGPPTFERLARNVALNPQYSSSIILENLGVSDKNTRLFWSEELRHMGRGNGSLRVGGNISVDVVTLDSYCQNKGIRDVNFIKIDVEGMEYDVLKGAKAVIKKYRPILYFETLPNIEKTLGFDVFEEIRKYLATYNYDFYSVNGQGNTKHENKVGLSVYTLAIYLKD